MRSRCDLDRRTVLFRNGEVFGAFVRRAERQHVARHAIGERRLADTRRSGDQPGLRRPPAADRARHAGQRRILPDEMHRLARMGKPFDTVGLGDLFAARALGHGQSLNRLATAFQIASAT